jgi:hypothetical protein
MNDICSYTILLRGQVSESEINALGPLQATASQGESHCTQLSFSTDQSGLVGLIGYLHGLGFVILCVERVEAS